MKLGIAPVGHSDKSPYNSIKALNTAWHKALQKNAKSQAILC